MPATPTATSAVPCRQGRPNESVTITAGATPKRAASASRIRAAEASGSRGRRTTQPSHGAFERSTPAFAQTKPCSVSAMTSSSRRRRTRRASRRTTARWSSACSTRPSAFDTAFCATTTTSPCSSPPARSTASPRSAPRSSPGRISGSPGSGRMRISAEAVTQAGQDVLREGLEEAPLIGAGRVKDEVVEAELDVRRDPLDALLRVVRDDEAARRPVGVRVGEALQLDRVFDPALLLRREGERGPPAAVVARALGVAVVGDLDLDQAVDARRVLPGLARALLDRVEELPVELRLLAARADEAVPDLARHLRRARPGGGHVDRDRVLVALVDRRGLRAVVRPLEGDALLGPEEPLELDRLDEPVEALLERGPLEPRGGRLVHRLTRADAEEDAAGSELCQRPERLRDDRRVIAERW